MKMAPGVDRDVALKQLRAGGLGQRARLFAGVGGDNSSKVVLSDKKGRARMQMQVAADGSASLQILDENGSVTSTFPPSEPDRRRPQ